METPLTVLYTHRIRGELSILPRMFNFIRQLQAYYSEDDVRMCPDDPTPPGGRTLLVDLGESCAPEVWPCALTGGRSTLVVLDAMGYAAANVSGVLTAEARARLGDSLQIGLVDAAHSWKHDDIVLTLTASAELEPAALHVILSPAGATRLEGSRLYLRGVEGTQIGAARLTALDESGTILTLQTSEVFDLPTRTLPDPTIAGLVDFVVSEARYTEKRLGR